MNHPTEWKDIVAATAAAERALAIIDASAQGSTRTASRGIVDVLWAIADNERSDPEEGLIASIESLPEANVTDPDRRAWFAMTALGVLHAAASILHPSRIADDDYADAAHAAFGGLDGMIDYVTPRVIDPRNPPPPGRFEAAEARRQLEDRELLVQVESRSDAVRALRERARIQHEELGPVVSDLLKRIRR